MDLSHVVGVEWTRLRVELTVGDERNEVGRLPGF